MSKQKQLVTNCNRLNVEKMLEALRKINRLCGIGVAEVSSFEIGSICDAALAAIEEERET